MLRCRICKCICDPSDLIGGICDDCRKEAEQREDIRERFECLMSAEFHQMRLDDIIQNQTPC